MEAPRAALVTEIHTLQSQLADAKLRTESLEKEIGEQKMTLDNFKRNWLLARRHSQITAEGEFYGRNFRSVCFEDSFNYFSTFVRVGVSFMLMTMLMNWV